MRFLRGGRYVATALVPCLLAVSACGSSAGEAANVPPKPGSQGTVTIGVLSWAGYDADVAVVSRVLETRLGYKVVTKKTTEKDMFAQMESGEIDVILENWGHDEDKKTYVDTKKTVVNAGPTGNRGVIGWYVPMWMAQQYPDIRDWRNLNKYADLFRTAETGERGQILDGDKTYLTNDPALVANLGLNYTVAYSGSEDATVKAATAASNDHKPLLFYFWEPHWLFSQQKYAKVNLPVYQPGCDADAAKIACDYAPYTLEKLASKKFADSGNKAYQLIKNFTWTNDAQNLVANFIVNERLSQGDAAKKWMDENKDAWDAWVPA